MYSGERKPAAKQLLFWTVAILLALWAAAAFTVRMPDTGAGAPQMIVAFCALAVAALALVLAGLALRKAARNGSELDALSRAFDTALRTRSKQARSRDIDEIGRMVAREVERLAQHGSADRPIRDISPAATQIQGDMTALVNRALSAGILEISLRPIVSLSQGAAAAFDAFAHFEIDAGNRMDIGRIHAGAIDHAAFERMLVMEAAATARRMLATQEGALVHVPISQALLASDGALASVLDMARAHPAAARSIVLNLPWQSVVSGNAEALDRLADAGFPVSAEAGATDTPDPQALGGRARWVRMKTERLLGRHGQHGGSASGHEIAEAMRAAGLEIIADDVHGDGDAIALADIGIDLMSGPRFSGPRRLRTHSGVPAGIPDAAE